MRRRVSTGALLTINFMVNAMERMRFSSECGFIYLPGPMRKSTFTGQPMDKFESPADLASFFIDKDDGMGVGHSLTVLRKTESPHGETISFRYSPSCFTTLNGRNGFTMDRSRSSPLRFRPIWNANVPEWRCFRPCKNFVAKQRIPLLHSS